MTDRQAAVHYVTAALALVAVILLVLMGGQLRSAQTISTPSQIDMIPGSDHTYIISDRGLMPGEKTYWVDSVPTEMESARAGIEALLLSLAPKCTEWKIRPSVTLGVKTYPRPGESTEEWCARHDARVEQRKKEFPPYEG